MEFPFFDHIKFAKHFRARSSTVFEHGRTFDTGRVAGDLQITLEVAAQDAEGVGLVVCQRGEELD